jgi:ribose transport system substrate-binding protein
MSRVFVLGAVLAAATFLNGCASKSEPVAGGGDKPHYAFITNCVAEFWEHAEAGTEQAEKDFDVDVDVIMPESLTEQTRKIEDLLIRGADGIAISPIDPVNQVDIINKAGAQTKLITHDSDAPGSNRQVYIGMDNFDAGLLCGKTLRDAMPDGGKVMIFVGQLDQDNAKRRRQGFIDGFLDRKPDRERIDPAGEVLSAKISGENEYAIIGTMTDQFDPPKAKANAEDALTRYPDLTGMVGLFEYNPPAILEALSGSGKLGKIKVMAFDENNATLQGIKDGNVVATVVQNPYQYGYESVRVLNELQKGNDKIIPESKFIDIPARVITQSNVDEFWKEIKERLAR